MLHVQIQLAISVKEVTTLMQQFARFVLLNVYPAIIMSAVLNALQAMSRK